MRKNENIRFGHGREWEKGRKAVALKYFGTYGAYVLQNRPRKVTLTFTWIMRILGSWTWGIES